MFTGKNKKQFEDWYINDFLKIGHTKNLKDHRNDIIKEFYAWYFEKQLGFYLAYYDSLFSIKIVNPITNFVLIIHLPPFTIRQDRYEFHKETRNEAYKEAFKKANDLINQ